MRKIHEICHLQCTFNNPQDSCQAYHKGPPYHKHDTDEGESTISTELLEDSISDTPTESSEDSMPVETPRLPTGFNKSTHDEVDSSITKPMTELEHRKRMGSRLL